MTATQIQSVPPLETAPLKKFAQIARRQLIEQIGTKLDRVLSTDSAELREKEAAIKELKTQLSQSSKQSVIERVAYIWFNRFCALRFMDLNQYTRVGTVSPAEGFTQPEILAEAKQGHIDESFKPFISEQRVFDLLSGRMTSRDPQQEAYRQLIVAVCNYYNSIMPFLFEKIADYTELLMPDDLLSEGSILAATRTTLTKDVCRDVEVIGWLYQFYISEKKDQVFDELKKNSKIAPENIPAATQLFTPHWIVRYLVENSLGRLWMLNKPKSRLIDRMDFYINPDEDSNFFRIEKPEELKICDPACGSGHMLVYAFDLLHAIYEEEGYDATDIPRLILENNLFGIEIDERAGELAAFALVMKARKRYRAFFQKPIQPRICIFQNTAVGKADMNEYIAACGGDVFNSDIQKTLTQFDQSTTFGSLIKPAASDASSVLRTIQQRDQPQNIFVNQTHQKALRALEYADYLSQKYNVVVTNPPYLDKFDDTLRNFAKVNYPNSKANTYSMFIERALELCVHKGRVALVTLQGWMFNSSYEKLREKLNDVGAITSMIHLGPRAFDSIGGEVVSTTAFCISKVKSDSTQGVFIDLTSGRNESEKSGALLKILATPQSTSIYRRKMSEFEKVPGAPIAYSASAKLLTTFDRFEMLGRSTELRAGLQTGDNGQFLRLWSEVSLDKIAFNCESRDTAKLSGKQWFPYNKGGPFRKWYGNNFFLVQFANDGALIKEAKKEKLRLGLITANNSKCWNLEWYFAPCLTWSSLSTNISMRYCDHGFIFDTKGQCLFANDASDLPFYSGLLNSRVCSRFLELLTPTLDFNSGYLKKIPDCKATIGESERETIYSIESKCREIAKADWDAYETSWDFMRLPLLDSVYTGMPLAERYEKLREGWRNTVLQMKALEEQNNRVFIEAYGLADELAPDVALCDVTLNCNPAFRYSQNADCDNEGLLLSDTARELISYAVGCMFGRYSLDTPGLIVANRAHHQDFVHSNSAFPPDEDNVIPILEDDWFTDDITERFRRFLRVAFGEEHYRQNLEFLERALGKEIRKYFLKDFYADHIKRYKKRPIYWLFSSPKGTFNALIYMHRYRPDTMSVILNDYVRELRNKLAAHKSHLETVSIASSVSAAEKTRALKEIEGLKKSIDELDTYERETLYPLAMQKLDIELDDGVKANYAKFGSALKSIPGMNAEED